MAATDPRPARRPWHAFAWLDHFAIVSYVVDPERLDALLPDGIDAERFRVDGDEVAVVSAVSCLDRRFRFRGLPLVTMSAGQIDYRAYVTRRDEHGVWFFGASLDSPLVAVARHLWSMPWHRDTVAVAARWRDDALEHLSLRADGAWGPAVLDLGGPTAGANLSADALAGFTSVTDPLVGWYATRSGSGRRAGVRRYEVWHPPLDLRPATVEHARHQVFVALGLVDADQPPVSALVQRTVALDVHTPPRRTGRDAARRVLAQPQLEVEPEVIRQEGLHLEGLDTRPSGERPPS